MVNCVLRSFRKVFYHVDHLNAEVGRVPKNCTQVKVLVEIFTQVKVIV